MNQPDLSSPVPAPEAIAELAGQLEEAMQNEWNDFCTDTGCHPEFIYREGRNIFADFRRSKFARGVAERLRAAFKKARFDAAWKAGIAEGAEVSRLRSQVEAWQQMANARAGLLACYRTGNQRSAGKHLDAIHAAESKLGLSSGDSEDTNK